MKIRKLVGPHKEILGNPRLWKVKKFSLKPQNDYHEKIFVIQLMEEIKLKKTEIRIGYYIIGKREKYKDKWAWGQFCPFIPPQDLEEIIKIIKNEGYVKPPMKKAQKIK